MENQNEKNVFTYTYSASEQEEVKRIREKYLPKQPDKMEQIRQLDRSVTKKGTRVSITLGIIGALVLGTGMSCAMVGTPAMFIPGIIIGAFGLVMVGVAYPLFLKITQEEKERIAPEILRLLDELEKSKIAKGF